MSHAINQMVVTDPFESTWDRSTDARITEFLAAWQSLPPGLNMKFWQRAAAVAGLEDDHVSCVTTTSACESFTYAVQPSLTLFLDGWWKSSSSCFALHGLSCSNCVNQF